MIKSLMTTLFGRAKRSMQSVIAATHRFRADTRAGVLIYVTATLPVIIGTALLAIDASRLMSMHTSLQKAADALAIAGAAELDRFPQSIQRSEIAIENLVKNSQFFGDSHADVIETISNTEIQTRYFAAIPSDDADSMGTPLDKTAATSYETARFVEVTIQPRTLNTIFPASFLPGGGVNSATATVVAVAGNDQVVCKLMPLFICNPLEPLGNTNIYDVTSIENCAKDPSCRRQLIHMRAGPGSGSTADYFPGNFGFLDMGSGAGDLERALAVGSPDACFLQTGVDTEPGQMTGPVENGVNVRFGLYPQNMSGITGAPSANPATRPAMNVRMAQNQGMSDNKICKDYEPVSDTDPTQGQPLPKDPCFLDTPHSCSKSYPGDQAGRLGDGGWGQTEMDAYWEANFGPAGATAPLSSILSYIGYSSTTDGNGTTTWKDPDGNTVSTPGWGQVTRYDIYNYELDTANLYQQLSPAPNDESGDPMIPPGARTSSCYSGGALTLTRDPDRRLLNGAILNCRALEAAGYKLSGKQTHLPVAAFAEFFITEPVRGAPSPKPAGWNDQNNNAIWTELVRVVKQGQGGNATSLDQVQLYR